MIIIVGVNNNKRIIAEAIIGIDDGIDDNNKQMKMGNVEGE